MHIGSTDECKKHIEFLFNTSRTKWNNQYQATGNELKLKFSIEYEKWLMADIKSTIYFRSTDQHFNWRLGVDGCTRFQHFTTHTIGKATALCRLPAVNRFCHFAIGSNHTAHGYLWYILSSRISAAMVQQWQNGYNDIAAANIWNIVDVLRWVTITVPLFQIGFGSFIHFLFIFYSNRSAAFVWRSNYILGQSLRFTALHGQRWIPMSTI